jgi:hypothetical protein
LLTRFAVELGNRGPANPTRDAAGSDVSDAERSEPKPTDVAEPDAALTGAQPLVAPSADALSEAARLDAVAARLMAAALGCRGGASFAPVPARRCTAGYAPDTRLA